MLQCVRQTEQIYIIKIMQFRRIGTCNLLCLSITGRNIVLFGIRYYRP